MTPGIFWSAVPTPACPLKFGLPGGGGPGATRVLKAVPKFSLNFRAPTKDAFSLPRDTLLHCRNWLDTPLTVAPAKLVLRPGWMKPATMTGLLTGSEVEPLIATEATNWVMPFRRPPPKPFTLARMLVMRYTRVEPEVTGGRIGIPAKVTWLAFTKPRYMLAAADTAVQVPAELNEVQLLITGIVPPPVFGT